MGELHNDRFMAHYGQMPAYHHPSQEDTAFRDFYGYKRPTHLALFFPGYEWLPTDVRQLLLCFVPSPSEFTPSTLDELPATFRLTWTAWRGDRRVEESEDVPLRVRETARVAEQDLRAMLRLVEAGRVPDG